MYGTKDIWHPPHISANNEENLKTTFSYLNSELQHEKLNRGAWKQLEAAVRKWAKYRKTTRYKRNMVFTNFN